MAYHYLPVFDVSEACAILRAEPKQYRKLKRLPSFAIRNTCGGSARWIAPGYDGEVLERLGPNVCESCLTGTPCSAWSDCDLSDYQPRRLDDTEMPERFHVEHVAAPRVSAKRACAVLGVAADASPDEIKRAFSRAMLRAHPDRGGSSAAVEQVLAARARLATQ